jgi:small subunit ribosomal protein S9
MPKKKETKKTTRSSKKKTVKKSSKKYSYALGRRKSAVVTIRLFEGKGENLMNGKKIEDLCVSLIDQKELYSPLEVVEGRDYFFTAKAKGGGKSSQLDALKLALARALEKSDNSLRKALKSAGFLSVDDRVKERKKPGLKKARKREQYSKR